MDGRDVERLECLLGKVTQIERDEDFGVRSHRGSQDVPVLLVVGHAADQRLVSGDLRVGKCQPHLLDPVADRALGDSGRNVSASAWVSRVSDRYNGYSTHVSRNAEKATAATG